MPRSIHHAVLLTLLFRAATAAAAPPPAELAAWATEAPVRVLPLVEEVTGRHLEHTPEVRFVGQSHFLAIEQARVAPQIAKAHPGADPQALAEAVGDYVRSLRHVTAAYEYDEGVIYVVWEPLAHALDFAPLPTEEATRAAVGCAIAHELTHALQGQEAGGPPTIDDPTALPAAAMREGMAMWVGAEVCRREDQEGAAAWHLLVQGALGQRERADRDLVYHQGYRYVANALGSGGMDAAWALVAKPPTRSAIEAATTAEEARWKAEGSGIDVAAHKLGWTCNVRREWRPEELRITHPPDLSPPEAVLDDLDRLSWCSPEPGAGVGHAVLADATRALDVGTLLRLRLQLPGGAPKALAAKGFDAAARSCDAEAHCTALFARGDRLAVIAGHVPEGKATRLARKVLAAGVRH